MRYVVEDTYFGDRTVKDLAAELGSTHAAVSQQRSEAIRLMRDGLTAHYADDPEQPFEPQSRITPGAATTTSPSSPNPPPAASRGPFSRRGPSSTRPSKPPQRLVSLLSKLTEKFLPRTIAARRRAAVASEASAGAPAMACAARTAPVLSRRIHESITHTDDQPAGSTGGPDRTATFRASRRTGTSSGPTSGTFTSSWTRSSTPPGHSRTTSPSACAPSMPCRTAVAPRFPSPPHCRVPRRPDQHQGRHRADRRGPRSGRRHHAQGP